MESCRRRLGANQAAPLQFEVDPLGLGGTPLLFKQPRFGEKLLIGLVCELDRIGIAGGRVRGRIAAAIDCLGRLGILGKSARRKWPADNQTREDHTRGTADPAPSPPGPRFAEERTCK